MAEPDRDYPSCLTLENGKMVIVAGGYTSKYELTATVEAYLIEENLWVPLSSLPIVSFPDSYWIMLLRNSFSQKSN